MDGISEVWRPVLGWEGLYEVSDLGRVRSLPRVRCTGKVLKAVLSPSKPDYRVVNLCHDGRKKMRPVHQLVCEAFHGQRPAGAHARHLDGDSLNNLASNLAWGSPRDNVEDSIRHGTFRTPIGRGFDDPNHPVIRAAREQESCKSGHLLTEENIYRPPASPNRRVCRTCQREANERRYSPEAYQRRYDKRRAKLPEA